MSGAEETRLAVMDGAQTPARLEDLTQLFGQLAQTMQGMATMIRTTNERMAALEQSVRLLTKVTPAQASAINAAIRDRARELCAEYRAPGCEAAVGNAIRRELKLTMGIQSVRDVPRCEYSVAVQTAKLWDDYKSMKAIKARGGRQK